VAPPVTIIGMGISPDDLTRRQRSIIEAADILVGGQRLIERISAIWPASDGWSTRILADWAIFSRRR
jgi:precorrin-6B methylase 1